MYLELAKKYLIKARAASGNSKQYFANLCQVCLAKQGASPEDIGSSQQELVVLQTSNKPKKKKSAIARRMKQTPVETCKKYLEQCRKVQGASRQYYANLCQSYLAKFAIEAAEIGTTAEELQGLQNKGFLESAINYLEEARNANGTRQKCYADLCWDYLGKAKATPEDIGSTEDELNSLTV